VTLSNRGTRGDLFPDAEHLRGDRAAGDLGALHGRRWDAAVDTACYLPAQVRYGSRWGGRSSASSRIRAISSTPFMTGISANKEEILP
jgi:hypothetical protein